MTEELNLQPIGSDFELIRKTTEGGQEYWSAREQATALAAFSYDGRIIMNKS